MDNPSESGKTISIPIASKGKSIKFAASERITSLTLCSEEEYLRNCKGEAHVRHTGEHKDQYEQGHLWFQGRSKRELSQPCLLYTSDAADEEDSVDLGGRRII